MRALLPALLLLAGPALAQAPQSCWVPYAEFEGHVSHIDAEDCPPGFGPEGEGFCRIAIQQDSITLYTFQEVGGQPCLVGVRRMDLAYFLSRYGVGPGSQPPR